jgi:hypothetical protein
VLDGCVDFPRLILVDVGLLATISGDVLPAVDEPVADVVVTLAAAAAGDRLFLGPTDES